MLLLVQISKEHSFRFINSESESQNKVSSSSRCLILERFVFGMQRLHDGKNILIALYKLKMKVERQLDVM